MTDLEENLFQKPEAIKTQFQALQEKVQNIVEELKVYNDQQQSLQIANLQYNDLQGSRKQFKIKADKTKELITQLDKIARGNEQNNIANKLKQQYLKEVDRQKRIMKSFVNSSFEQKFSKISVIRQSKAYGQETAQEQLKYFVDQNYVKVVPKDQRVSNNERSNLSQVHAEEATRIKTVSIDEDFVENDMIDLENMLIDERQRELDIIEREALQLNLIVNQMGELTDQQGQELDFGQQNLNEAKANVIGVSNELVGAEENQKQSMQKYKYVIGGLIVVIIVLIIVFIVK
ncbi:unnamed protein product (macronuclear) [Paramecium tetraurelia]|uniref:Chromosome undetermined scaffold_20, whole genome shotgun sequence n=1 Tax=Paramecium tetraurelia TaxID=5888 RepID=Q3M103_PARTE|nr:uncharacterized protein GSPATT00008137001 [Paramecium tetraurelia]CAH69619.1 syntaxin 7-1 [Paramecium tetraurelia]CAK71589.1 unnamed protein product [Paramecium tetraurelia]|eukprot:XP_001438986.1 hypothetical protein (macronuclear) [Paramecium tetraurelia strain d4-2]